MSVAKALPCCSGNKFTALCLIKQRPDYLCDILALGHLLKVHPLIVALQSLVFHSFFCVINSIRYLYFNK